MTATAPAPTPEHTSIVAGDLADVCERARSALDRLAGSTVLVTGGAGFLPSYLVDAMARANQSRSGAPTRVVSLDNYATGTATRLAHLRGREDVAFVDADLAAGVSLDEPVDYIVHGASIASPTWYRQRPLETIDVNVGGTRALLELARRHGVRGFLQLSSSEVYGDPPSDRIPTSEDYWGHVSSLGPRACYDESKRLGETLCMTYHRVHGVPVKIVRPFNVYGPRLRLDDGRMVPDFLRDALAGEPITVYSDGRATRSFCYVSDATVAMLRVLTADVAGEAFNVGNDEEVTVAEVAALADEVRGGGPGVSLQVSEDPEYLVDNPRRRCPDLRKLERAVAYQPTVMLREGLRRTYDHYREASR